MKFILIFSIFLVHINLVKAAINLDASCKDDIEKLLNIPVGKNFKINLKSNEVMFEGRLFMQKDPDSKENIIWSLYEEERADAYRSPFFALHAFEDGDKILILDKQGNLLYRGFFFGHDEKTIISFDGMNVKYSPLRKPMLYKDKAFTNQILSNTEFVRLFANKHKAYVIKDKNKIEPFIYNELLFGQTTYEKHIANPKRFVDLGDGVVIEMKPNHELISLKIDRDIDSESESEKFLFRDEKGTKTTLKGNVYVVEQDGSVTVLKGAFLNSSNEIAKIAHRQPRQILVERKMRFF